MLLINKHINITIKKDNLISQLKYLQNQTIFNKYNFLTTYILYKNLINSPYYKDLELNKTNGILFTNYKININNNTNNLFLTNKFISLFNKKGKKKKYFIIYLNTLKYLLDFLSKNTNKYFSNLNTNKQSINTIDYNILINLSSLKSYYLTRNLFSYFLKQIAPIFQIKIIKKKKKLLKKILYIKPNNRYKTTLKFLYFFTINKNTRFLNNKIKILLYNEIILGTKSTLINYKIKLYKKALQSNLYN